MTNLIITGANGKMGKVIQSIVANITGTFLFTLQFLMSRKKQTPLLTFLIPCFLTIYFPIPKRPLHRL